MNKASTDEIIRTFKKYRKSMKFSDVTESTKRSGGCCYYSFTPIYNRNCFSAKTVNFPKNDSMLITRKHLLINVVDYLEDIMTKLQTNKKRHKNSYIDISIPKPHILLEEYVYLNDYIENIKTELQRSNVYYIKNFFNWDKAPTNIIILYAYSDFLKVTNNNTKGLYTYSYAMDGDNDGDKVIVLSPDLSNDEVYNKFLNKCKLMGISPIHVMIEPITSPSHKPLDKWLKDLSLCSKYLPHFGNMRW